MAGKSIVILGGGFGGITAALESRRGLGSEHTVTLIERRPNFMMGLRKLWMLIGRGTRDEGTRSLKALENKGIILRQAMVTGIDTRARKVATDSGEVPFDYLVVALGAEPRPNLILGFSSSAFNLYDADDVERLAAKVATFPEGQVVIGIMGLPYKCPPAPYEAAMLLDDLFQKKGIRQKVQIQTFTPQPMSLPVVGAAGCAQVEGQLAGKGIGFQPNRKAMRLEGTTVVFDGDKLQADLLICVPPHRPPKAVAESELAGEGSWIRADPGTLRTKVEGISAIGDVVEITLANNMPLPKAGVFAEAQAKVAAGEIVAEIIGQPTPPPFNGQGYCFLEGGGGKAMLVTGNFYASPAPQVQVAPPSAEAYQEKGEFERSRLAEWFR